MSRNTRIKPVLKAGPWLISGTVLIADRLTKAIVVRTFVPGETHPLFPPLVHLTYVQNAGAAFGMFKGYHVVFVVCSFLVAIWLVRLFLSQRPMSSCMLWGCAFVLGGAVGNLIDRLCVGYVVDFIDLRVWPVFNVGDSAITIGVSLLLLDTYLSTRR